MALVGSNQFGHNLESGKGKWHWSAVINLAIIDYQTLFRITFWQCYARWFIVLLLSSHTVNQNDHYFCAALFTFSQSL